MNPDYVAIKYEVRNIRWLKDEWGDYWVAELWSDGKRLGLTGSYYGLDETGNQRYSRAEQEKQIEELFPGGQS